MVADMLHQLDHSQDAEFEDDVRRNPYNIKSWFYYIEAKSESKRKIRNLVFERSLQKLPGSYKLWLVYVRDRKRQCLPKSPEHPIWQAANNVFERALVFMHKMPRVWLEYLEFLQLQSDVRRTRSTFDRALASLPVTQHHKVWPLYLKFVKKIRVNEVSKRVYRRYIKLYPENVEEYIKFLKMIREWDEAALLLAKCVNDEDFSSKTGKTKHHLWKDLISLMCKHPDDVSLNVDAILRGGIRRYTHEVGRLWVALADYYIRLGQFERARDVYEEAINSISTVRDFSICFDSYTKYEESMLSAKMEALGDSDSDNSDSDSDDELDPDTDFELGGDDLDLRIARFEALMDRRPLLLNSVLLRQNPHNVEEWLKRVKIFEDDEDLEKCIETFTQGVTTVDPQLATGRVSSLWIGFAKFYEEYGDDLENARVIFEKATHVNYRGIDELASLWCAWAEMEIRHENFRAALDVMARATTLPPDWNRFRNWKDPNMPVQDKLFKSTKLWSFYCDLEESLGTLETTKAVYNRMIELKIATPQIIINFAHYMEEHKYFEESFKVYEQGVAAFRFPHAKPIWLCYLNKFVTRYKGAKLERTRELFAQVLDAVPATDASQFFLQHAKFEAVHAQNPKKELAVYEMAVTVIPPAQRYEMFNVYLNRVAENFGVTKQRPIFEKAIKNLPDSQLGRMILRYINLERKLGEIDRARALMQYGSQFVDPRQDQFKFWEEWNEFELAHGNQDTFREMMRIKRSVQVEFHSVSIQQGFVKGETLGSSKEESNDSGSGKRKAGTSADELKLMDDIERLEAQTNALNETKDAQFGMGSVNTIADVQAMAKLGDEVERGSADPNEIDLSAAPSTQDPDEIDLNNMEVERRDLPDFMQETSDALQNKENLGAMARFKKQKTS